jgi:hypothetical protein
VKEFEAIRAMVQAFNSTPTGTHLALMHYSYNDYRTTSLFTFVDPQSAAYQTSLIDSFTGQIPFYTGYSDLTLYVIV